MNRGGKMKLLLRSLLLSSLCALSSWSVSSGTFITQSSDVSVQEGEKANITCCWNRGGDRVRITWLKNQTLIENKTVINQSTVSDMEQKNKCSVLIIEKTTRNDSGKYICKVTVEIPVLKDVEGNGTTITVTARKNQPDSTVEEQGNGETLPHPVIIAVGVVVPLFLITLICFCSLRKKKGQAARVIYEVPHTDSIEADMDKSSTSSSRGSTQWCEVAMYDSLDYFERVEPKRTK